MYKLHLLKLTLLHDKWRKKEKSLNWRSCSLALDSALCNNWYKIQQSDSWKLGSVSNSPTYLELYPSPPKLADTSGAKRQIWSYFTEQTEADT